MENTTKTPLYPVTHFDRHASMSDQTRKDILRLTSILEYRHNARKLVNWLYGALDGYDYGAGIETNSSEFTEVNYKSPSLGKEVLGLFNTINTYPRTTTPNNNNH